MAKSYVKLKLIKWNTEEQFYNFTTKVYKYTYFMNNIHKLIRKFTKNGEKVDHPKNLH